MALHLPQGLAQLGVLGPPTHGRPGAGAEDAIAAKSFFSSHTPKPLSRIKGLFQADGHSLLTSSPCTAHSTSSPGEQELCTLTRLRSAPTAREEHVTGKEAAQHGR